MNDPVRILLHTYSLRFQFQHQPDFDIFAFIDLAASLGFDGVAISANDPDYRHLQSKSPAQFARIRQRLEQHQLICDLDTSGTAPDHLATLIDVAHQVGARQLRTYTRYPYPETLTRTAADLAQIGPVAAAAGITVMLENHETFTGAEIAGILAAVDHPNVKALFDYGNSQMALEDPLVALAAMAPYARSAHIKDHVVWPGTGRSPAEWHVLGVPLGQGYLPIAQLTQQLYAAGLRELVLEDSWGYHAPFKPERITPAALAQIGQGSFGLAQPPLANERYWFNTTALPLAWLVDEELASLQRSWVWLQHLLTDLGLPRATR